MQTNEDKLVGLIESNPDERKKLYTGNRKARRRKEAFMRKLQKKLLKTKK